MPHIFPMVKNWICGTDTLRNKKNLESIFGQWEYAGQVPLKIRNPRKYS
jgi:hypothetical protein